MTGGPMQNPKPVMSETEGSEIQNRESDAGK